ncbi:MAG: hypothetical protein V7K55_03765 [Nostoc sp.]|uniref:hypothetical protein n=1 Tax=Nostoc sp. TaxID=1180 RepID=UPI002FF57229
MNNCESENSFNADLITRTFIWIIENGKIYFSQAQLQQFFIKPATKINSKTKPSIGFSTFIRGAFDCDLL